MAQGSVPYSDLMAHEYRSNVLGSALPLVANMLFWLWFINFNVGIFNALPIGPLDGGQFYKSLIENRIRSRPSTLKNAATLVTLVMTVIVVIAVLLPWLWPH